MVPVNRNQLHANNSDYCCCCCCCCYSNDQTHHHQQQQQNEIISANDSYCSCCSCESSIEEAPFSYVAPIEPKTPDDKVLKKKHHAIEELLQTERDYVQDLSHLVEVCLEVLSRQSWITIHNKATIIRNAPAILDFHKNFISQFETTSLSTSSSIVAQTFIDEMSNFKLYTHYCDMHAEAWALCSEYRDQPEWSLFLKDCAILDSYSLPSPVNSDIHMSCPPSKRLHFEDYLIKPVQRICRYQLLIKEIIRYTSPQTSEHDLWSAALEEMQDIVAEIDRRKLECDLRERTLKFTQRLDTDWRLSRRHVDQLGNLLIAGAIEVTYSALGSTVSKPRYLGCFIFSTYLIMIRPKKATFYEPKYWFPLYLADFEDLTDIEGQRENSFIVRCKKHTFAFSASCSQEKQLWTKKIQAALIDAKNERKNTNFSAEDFIVSSLSGITCKRVPERVRLSRSFTMLLDTSSSGENSKKSDMKLRRSMSTNIQFEDIPKALPPLPEGSASLQKRYSADYTLKSSSLENQKVGLKPRNNSEMYIKPDPFGTSATPKRRPSSLDLLSGNGNMIGKMSFQFKNNHQHALRLAVDHKLRDVCTQDYLSSRALHMRDKDQIASYHSAADLTANIDLLKKKKSTSFIRSSTSSFSLIPKRTSDSRQTKLSECDAQSLESSTSSVVEKQNVKIISSNSILRKLSLSTRNQSYSDINNAETKHAPQVKRKSSQRKLVNKVLRRITSLHQRTSPCEDNTLPKLKKTESMYSRITLKRPKKHDENMSIDRTDDDKEPTSLSAFSFASTPIGSSKKNGWKSRLSFIRPVSLLKNNKSNTSVY